MIADKISLLKEEPINPLPIIISIIVVISLLFIISIIIKVCIRSSKRNEINTQMSSLISEVTWYDIKKFYLDNQNQNIPGIYIFNNKTKNMCYVRQSINVYKRICQHIDGKGNQQLYWDMKTDDVVVGTVLLKNTNYPSSNKQEIKISLDELEQKMIFKYHSTETGYNKNRGTGLKSNSDFKWLYKKKKRNGSEIDFSIT